MAIAAARVAVPSFEPDGARTNLMINYYGKPGAIKSATIDAVLRDPNKSDCANKVIFVGQGPSSHATTAVLDGESPIQTEDLWSTPLTTDKDSRYYGVEIQATICNNIINNDWIQSSPRGWNYTIVCLFGLLAGIPGATWSLRRLIISIAIVTFSFLGLSFLLFVCCDYLLPWTIVSGPQFVASLIVACLPVKTAFICYRRVDGQTVALLVHNGLRRFGVNAFVDVKDHASGMLDNVLSREIRRRHNFIVILTPQIISQMAVKTGNTRDVVEEECRVAIRSKKNIVPVWTESFESCREWDSIASNEVRQISYGYKRCNFSSLFEEESVAKIARAVKGRIRSF